MNVLIIDDHSVVVQGCRRLLEGLRVDDIVVASTLPQGFRLYRQRHPDVVILDLSLQSRALSGLSFIRRMRLHDRNVPIMVLSMHADPGIARRALLLGANAYVVKDASPQEFIDAFQKVSHGHKYISQELAQGLAFEDDQPSLLKALTLRELETLSLLAAGKSYGVIAEELHVSYKTVVNTIAVLKQKLGVRTLSALTRIAVEAIPASDGTW
jgi:DNA-binding NarL/FixJ family response regulator